MQRLRLRRASQLLLIERKSDDLFYKTQEISNHWLYRRYLKFLTRGSTLRMHRSQEPNQTRKDKWTKDTQWTFLWRWGFSDTRWTLSCFTSTATENQPLITSIEMIFLWWWLNDTHCGWMQTVELMRKSLALIKWILVAYKLRSFESKWPSDVFNHSISSFKTRKPWTWLRHFCSSFRQCFFTGSNHVTRHNVRRCRSSSSDDDRR